MVVAALIAPALRSLDQAYQFIQEYVGFFSPGVLAIFLLGMFWKRTTSAAAMAGAVFTIPFSAVLKFLPVWTNGSFPDIPFLNRMLITFFATAILMILISLGAKSLRAEEKIHVEKSYFRVAPSFVISSVFILGILAALYTVFW